MRGRTALDIAVNTKAWEFERWLESPESLPWWGFLGFITLAIIVLYIAAAWFGDLFYWASRSWKRLLLAPFYVLALVAVVILLYRVGTLTNIVPVGVESVLERAVGR